MNCPLCQAVVQESAKFCPECGLRLGGSPGGAGSDSLGDDVTLGSGSRDGKVLESVPYAPLEDRFNLLDPLGRGGFATVFKAYDRNLCRHVAIKRLHGKHSGALSMPAWQRFQREARAIAQLNHRNIVQVFEQARDKEGYYIVMELVSGGTLHEHCREHRPLAVEEAVRILKGVCRGLSFAHRRNLVHRDIKPRNILLASEDGEWIPKITDFGLARVGTESDLSMTGATLGSPWYMPPEQRRDAKRVNHTADIYALGKTLYELVTGESPENVDPELLKAHPGISQIVFRCIKTQPEDRYFSVDDLLRDLDGVGTAPVRTAGAGPGAPLEELIRRNACPQCLTANRTEDRYCLVCGTSLVRTCPECDREASPHVRFCGGCGTDIEAFLALQGTAESVETLTADRHWGAVVKECAELPKQPKLPGARARKLLDRLKSLAETAWMQDQEVEQLRTALAKAELGKPRLYVLRELRKVAARDPAVDQEIQQLEEEIARREEEQRQAKKRYLEEQRQAELRRKEEEERQKTEAKLLQWKKQKQEIDKLADGLLSTNADDFELVLEDANPLEDAERRLAQLVWDAMSDTRGKPTKAHTDAANALIRETGLPLDVAKTIIARVRKEWSNGSEFDLFEDDAPLEPPTKPVKPAEKPKPAGKTPPPAAKPKPPENDPDYWRRLFGS